MIRREEISLQYSYRDQKDQWTQLPSTVTITPQSHQHGKDHRSVLENKQKTYDTVTWDTSQSKIDKKNPKLRERHYLELVIARVMRAKAAKAAAAA